MEFPTVIIMSAWTPRLLISKIIWDYKGQIQSPQIDRYIDTSSRVRVPTSPPWIDVTSPEEQINATNIPQTATNPQTATKPQEPMSQQ